MATPLKWLIFLYTNIQTFSIWRNFWGFSAIFGGTFQEFSGFFRNFQDFWISNAIRYSNIWNLNQFSAISFYFWRFLHEFVEGFQDFSGFFGIFVFRTIIDIQIFVIWPNFMRFLDEFAGDFQDFSGFLGFGQCRIFKYLKFEPIFGDFFAIFGWIFKIFRDFSDLRPCQMFKYLKFQSISEIFCHSIFRIDAVLFKFPFSSTQIKLDVKHLPPSQPTSSKIPGYLSFQSW